MTGEGCLDSVSHRVDGIESSTYIKTTPKLPNVYHLKRGSGGKLRLDCSRELRLPCLPSDHWYPQLCTDSNSKVHLASVSENGNIIAVCLSDGFIWFYNLEIICWISCISTKLSIDFVTKFLSQRFSIDVFEEYERLQVNRLMVSYLIYFWLFLCNMWMFTDFKSLHSEHLLRDRMRLLMSLVNHLDSLMYKSHMFIHSYNLQIRFWVYWNN